MYFSYNIESKIRQIFLRSFLSRKHLWLFTLFSHKIHVKILDFSESVSSDEIPSSEGSELKIRLRIHRSAVTVHFSFIIRSNFIQSCIIPLSKFFLSLLFRTKKHPELTLCKLRMHFLIHDPFLFSCNYPSKRPCSIRKSLATLSGCC